MSESVKLPAAVELEKSEEQRQEKEELQKQDDKKVSEDNIASLEVAETAEDGQEDVPATVKEETCHDRSLEFQTQNAKEAEEKNNEKKIQENVQEEVEEHSKSEVNNSNKEPHAISTIDSTLEQKIEDESMPTLVSSKIDETQSIVKDNQDHASSETQPDSYKVSPKQKEESDDDSVCVIDDDDDDEEDIGVRHCAKVESYDEDSSSYYDSEEMDEADNSSLSSTRKIRSQRNVDIEDDEEEEDEEEGEDGEEEMDDDSNPDIFGDGGSDDSAIRRKNGLNVHHEERSASAPLENLNVTDKDFDSPKKKRNVNPFSQKARYVRNQIGVDHREHRKSFPRIEHENKVRKFIADIGEQRRKSFEENRQLYDGYNQRKSIENEAEIYTSEENVSSRKNVKNFAERASKETPDTRGNEMFITQSIENGEISIYPKGSLDNGESGMKQEEMEIDPIQIDSSRITGRIEKVNGVFLSDDQNNYVQEKGGLLRRDDYKPVLNGQNQAGFGNDLHTLTYDEYMSGSKRKRSNYDNDEVIEESEIEKIETIQEENLEKCNVNQPEAVSLLRIENVTSNYYNSEATDNYINPKIQYPNQQSETYYQETPDSYSLRIALEQRNSQFDNLRDSYQRILSDKIAMKLELDNLKKLISQHKKGGPIYEQKTVSTQTEVLQTTSMPILQSDALNEQEANLFSNSLSSAMSSKWSDITGSIANSSEPPHIDTNLFHSDESSIQAKLKQKNPFSRAFVTSTKILQTLSSITHGKSKSKFSKSLIPEATASLSTQSEQVANTNSRKRKAADTISSKPFKIPHTESSERSQDGENIISKSPKPQIDNVDQEKGVITLEAETNSEEKETNDPEDVELEDIKVFEYEDDDDGAKSFLIQANEVSLGSKSGTVKECGPYLLGNIEVYMTEKDGTINIWGKEMNSSNKNEEKVETLFRSNRAKTDTGCQSTPRLGGYQDPVTTSGRKSRARLGQPQRHSCDALLEYENLSSHNRVPPCFCNHRYPIRCGYMHGRYKSEPYCNSTMVDPHGFSLPDVRHSNPCYHNPGKNHRHSLAPLSDDGEETSDGEENLVNTPHSDLNDTLVPPSDSSIRKSTDSTELSPFENEQGPAVFQRPRSTNQTLPKHRTSGKKVRGLLLNILKGCGDCRAPSDITTIPNEPGTSTEKKEPLPNQRSSSNPNEKPTNNQIDIAAQLDAFRAEIERLSNQEDALRKLLQPGTSTNVEK